MSPGEEQPRTGDHPRNIGCVLYCEPLIPSGVLTQANTREADGKHHEKVSCAHTAPRETILEGGAPCNRDLVDMEPLQRSSQRAVQIGVDVKAGAFRLPGHAPGAELVRVRRRREPDIEPMPVRE